MAKFLGSGGVQYLWTKAKETFYENGNDITLKNGKKISVLAGDGTSTSNETVITSDGVTVGAVKNDMSDPYIGYKNAMDKDGLHIYGVDPGGNQDTNERVDITSSGVKYSGAQGNGRTLKLGFEGAGFPQLTMDGNPGESKSVKIDFDDVIVQNESTTHKLSDKVDKVAGKSLIDSNVANAITYKDIIQPDSNNKNSFPEGVNCSDLTIGGTVGVDGSGVTTEKYIVFEPAASADPASIQFATIKRNLANTSVHPTVTWSDVKFNSDGTLNLGAEGLLKMGDDLDIPKVTINATEGLIFDGSSSTTYSPGIKITSINGEIKLTNESGTHKLSAKADKTYVDSLKPVTFTVSVPTTGWSTLTDSNGETYYKLTITASNAISTGYPVCDVVLPDDIAAARLQENAYKCINKVSVGSGNVTLYCFEEIPSVAFTIRIQIARS